MAFFCWTMLSERLFLGFNNSCPTPTLFIMEILFFEEALILDYFLRTLVFNKILMYFTNRYSTYYTMTSRIKTLFHSNLLNIIIKLKVDIKQKKENRFYKKFVTYLVRVSVNYLAAVNLKPRTSSFGLSYVLAKSNINFHLARIFRPMTS